MKSRYFHFGGFTFIPVASLPEGCEFNPEHVVTDSRLDGKLHYNYIGFMSCISAVNPALEIVWCVELEGFYFPCKDKLCKYTGTVIPKVDYESLTEHIRRGR